MSGQRHGPDLFHRLRIDDENLRTVVFIGIDMAVGFIECDRVDRPRYRDGSQNFERFRVGLGNGFGVAVSGVDFGPVGAVGDAVHGSNFDLMHDRARVGVDDQERSGPRMGGINAPMRRIDRNVIETTRHRNGHGRGHRYERHIDRTLTAAYESNMNAAVVRKGQDRARHRFHQIRCCKVNVNCAGAIPNSSLGAGFDLLTVFVIGAVPNPM